MQEKVLKKTQVYRRWDGSSRTLISVPILKLRKNFSSKKVGFAIIPLQFCLKTTRLPTILLQTFFPGHPRKAAQRRILRRSTVRGKTVCESIIIKNLSLKV
jgi:ribosomal protein S6E (S10)